ncbi:unnamed protein product [Calypogeia fissa]
MLSDMLAREQHPWQDELLAMRIETANVKQSFTGSNSNLRNVFPKEDQMYNLFFAEARDDRGNVGVGCVMKDTEGQVVFETRECLGHEISHHFAEYTALINGLTYARSAGVRRINAYGDRAFIYWEFQGMADAWTLELLNLMDSLYKQVTELSSFNMNCISRTENEDAIKLAKRAIAPYKPGLHYTRREFMRLKGKGRLEDDTRKECLICLEKIFPSDMVCQKGCDHRFCFNCLSQHVETEIAASKVPIRCPQFFTCAIHMGLYDCQRLVTPTLFDMYTRRLAEATISDAERVYCPYPSCSAMMCRNDDKKTTRTSRISSWSSLRRTPSTCTQCMECYRLFCVECQVPWHANLSCQQYQRLPASEKDEEDLKLLELAKEQNWRRCKKCRSLIVLAHGCFHMTCRCGYEFCYTCETEYENKKKMCKCPLFPVADPGPVRTR